MTAVLPGFRPTSALQLRHYQAEAIAAAYEFLRNRDDNPCIVLPTGAGKTPVMASLCHDAVARWGGRVLVLSHVRELVDQTSSAIAQWFPHINAGVYSAGLRRRDRRNDVLVASVQSVYRRGCELSGSRPFNLVLVDEAHRIPTEGDGMYRQLLYDLEAINPKVRVIGLTATPYRLKGGYVCGPSHFLNAICHETGIRELIAKGYLSALRTKQTRNPIDESQFHVRSGEFVASEMEAAYGASAVVAAAVAEILELAADRKSILMFCCSVAHAHAVADRIEEATGEECGVVTGETPADLRERTLAEFKAGRLRFLSNVNVLTEGFDATRIDCVCLLRSTLSPGLYYQMVGRGLRLHEGKEDCLVLDFGGNALRHGCVDAIRVKDEQSERDGETDSEPPAKRCPKCDSVCHAALARCPDCEFLFANDRVPSHEGQASDAAILSDQIQAMRREVTSVLYSVHVKRGADESAPRTMRVTYYDGLNAICDEWICVEHAGYAWDKAHAWWVQRTDAPMPRTAEEAVAIAEAGALAEPSALKIKRAPGQRFPRIVAYELGPRPNVEGRELVETTDEWGDVRWVFESVREPGDDPEPFPGTEHRGAALAQPEDQEVPF